MNIRRLILFLLPAFILFQVTAYAASVDTITTYSASMKKNIKAVIITPDGYSKEKHFAAVYLLHGYSGNYADWISKVPAIKDLADLYHLIIICPDGNTASWYLDSPENPEWRYETYISKELVQWVDQHYATIQQRSARAITGLSMGGHGALLIAFKHQDVFGAVGSMSGGVDLRPFPDKWDLNKVLGDYSKYPQRWDDNSVINLTYLLKPGALRIIFDCGCDDFFYTVNKNLHEKLLERNIAHDFTVRPGGHSWQYWANSINYQMLYFSRYFKGE